MKKQIKVSLEQYEQLKKLRDGIVNLIIEIEQGEGYEDEYYLLLKENLYGTDLEFLVPYLLELNIVLDARALKKLAKSSHCTKSRWIYKNQILPFIDVDGESNLRVCPLPYDKVNGLHNSWAFHDQAVIDLFEYRLQTSEEFLVEVKNEIATILKSEALRKQNGISINSNNLSQFNINNYVQLQRQFLYKFKDT